MSMVFLTCVVCKQEFQRKKSLHEHSLRRAKGPYQPKCSPACVAKEQSLKAAAQSVNVKCSHCDAEFVRPGVLHRKNQKNNSLVFCSRSCTSKYYGKLKKKAEKGKLKKSVVLIRSLTKGELFAKRSNWQSARSAIQRHARATYLQSDMPKQCCICGYSKHYEVAHRIPVSAFTDDILVSEINCLSNLVALCPNHHWEQENDHLCLP